MFPTFISLVLTFVTIALAEDRVIRQSAWSMDDSELQSINSLELAEDSRTRRSVIRTHPFSSKFQEAIVGAHNNARNTASPQAANMREMVWDIELATVAESYSQRCRFEHNSARSHSRFPYVGENIYISTGVDYSEDYVVRSVVAWDNEKVDYDYGSNSCDPGKICGHYTQVVWADSFAVGCGATLCSAVNVNGRTWRDATVLICNYGPGGNIVGSLPFISGTPCSRCEDPSDTCRNALCSNPSRLSAPTNAEWLEWGEWSACTRACDTDVDERRRTRVCSTYVEADCSGFSTQVDRFCTANGPCVSPGGDAARWKANNCMLLLSMFCTLLYWL